MIDVPVFVDENLPKVVVGSQTKLVVPYIDDYMAGAISQKEISNKTGVLIGTVANILHVKGARKNKIYMVSRLKPLLRFYENGIYSAKQISIILSSTEASVRWALSNLGAERGSLANRVERLVDEGFSFDAALKLLGKNIDQYMRSAK